MTSTRAQNVADTIAANGVGDLFDLIGIHFTAHEGLAGATAAARDQHFFEAGLARTIVALIFAAVSSAFEELAADLIASRNWI